jgi:hypothetical protein
MLRRNGDNSNKPDINVSFIYKFDLDNKLMIRWDTIQNVFYRKDEIYSMGWKVPDLSDYLYAAARNGGPIGMSSL